MHLGTRSNPADATNVSRCGALHYLPVSLFASVMGLTGLSVAWGLAHEQFRVPGAIADSVGAAAIAAFIGVAGGYIIKIVGAPQAVRDEFTHPVAGNLFGTVLISLLLLPIVLAPLSLTLARAIWTAGAVGMTAFAWLIVNRWLGQRQIAAGVTPAWIIPVVGLLDIPLAVPSIRWQSLHGVMVAGLAIGLFFTVPLFTLIFSRLLLGEPLAPALQPTLMILVAPFAVGTSAYVTTVGQVDVFAEALFALTLFMLVILTGRLWRLAWHGPFRLSWWAVSFPIAAAAIAALRIAAALPDVAHQVIAVALLSFTTFVIGGLFARTLLGLFRGQLQALSE
jgi:tellurite resistance protein